MGLTSSVSYSYGVASLIDFVVLLVASIIAFQSHKIYKYLKETKYNLFSWAFLLIAVSYLFKIFSNLTIVHRIVIQRPGAVIVLLGKLNSMQLFQFLSFIVYKSLSLLGFLLLFLIVLKTKKKSETILFIYLSAVTILFSIFLNSIFHLTTAIILLFLTSHFYENSKNTKSRNSSLVFKSFLLMFIGSVIAIFTGIYPISHLIGEAFRLAGFIVLLMNHLSPTLKNGKKTNKTRGSKRYSRSAKKK